MNRAIKEGLSFGLTSGVITPLGLMMGLSSSTHSRLAVIGGILTIAVADALSDAMGIHMSEESNKKNSHKNVWKATFAAFFAKFGIALTFLVPLIWLTLSSAVVVNIIWGILLLVFFNVLLARQRGESAWNLLKHHGILIVFVLLASHFAGKLIAAYFGAV